MSQEHVKTLFQWLSSNPLRAQALSAAESLQLKDWWIGAGFVRNLIWDQLHCLPPTALNDIDLIYFDPEVPSTYDKEIENQLKINIKENNFSVTNQAHVHKSNGHHPYESSAHAMTFWPEVCTCVGVKLDQEKLKILAPFGLDDNFNLIVRPNKHKFYKKEIYRGRLEKKKWKSTYKNLKILGD